MKEQARRESDLIVHEAHAEARRVTRESVAEKRRLEEDVIKIRAQLLAAFETLGEWPRSESTTSEEADSRLRPADIAEAWRAAFAAAPPHRSRRSPLLASANDGVVPERSH